VKFDFNHVSISNLFFTGKIIKKGEKVLKMFYSSFFSPQKSGLRSSTPVPGPGAV
jgi:hypothetical protein